MKNLIMLIISAMVGFTVFSFISGEQAKIRKQWEQFNQMYQENQKHIEEGRKRMDKMQKEREEYRKEWEEKYGQ